MKPFEKTVISILGCCCVVLFLVAASKIQGMSYQSPKARFTAASIDADLYISDEYRSSKDRKYKKPKYITVNDLAQKFTLLNYNFGNILDDGASVPRILVLNMPYDIRNIKTPVHRKRVFFKTVLPLVLEANKLILRDRQRILKIKHQKVKTGKVSAVDKLWLAVISEKYKIKQDDFSLILRHVDIIPPSMALAQAAEESGWGTSRFVLEGNALFGQYTFGSQYSLIPKERDAGKAHSIRTFASLLEAVRSYAHNLNTHRAYRKFRTAREIMRRNGREITGNKLIVQLTNYSERGKKYINSIRSIINVNRLNNLDKKKLQADFIITREP